jgi:hypothetical protein
MLEQEISITLFPGENLPVVGRDTSCQSGFQVEKGSFSSKYTYSV